MLTALVTGLAVGVATSVPPGPVAALAIRASLGGDRRAVVALALGSALVEGLYALLAGVGVSAVLVRAPAVVTALYGIGGVVLLAFGTRCLTDRRRARADPAAAPAEGGVATSLLAGVVLTLSNPVPLVSWIAVAGTFFARFDRAELELAAAGVVVGVLAWIAGVGLLSGRLGASPTRAVQVSRLVGVLLVVGGVYFLARAVA